MPGTSETPEDGPDMIDMTVMLKAEDDGRLTIGFTAEMDDWPQLLVEMGTESFNNQLLAAIEKETARRRLANELEDLWNAAGGEEE